MCPCSGGTPEYPNLIKYACDLMTNVRVVTPALVTVPEVGPGGGGENREGAPKGDGQNGGRAKKYAAGRLLPGPAKNGGELMSAVLGGRPVVPLAFDDMVVRPSTFPLPCLYATAQRHHWILGLLFCHYLD